MLLRGVPDAPPFFQRAAAAKLLQRTLELIVPLRRVHRHGAGIAQPLFLYAAADALVAEGVQRRGGDNVADAARVSGGISVADVAGEVCGDVAARLDDGA